MDYRTQDYYASKMAGLRDEYRAWVAEVTTGEDYFRGMDLDEAISQAFDMQQNDDYIADQLWAEQMAYEDEKKHQLTREEKYPGVIFTPKIKISTICEDDDLAF